MSASIPSPFGAIPAARGKIMPSLGGTALGVFRLPTDPLYFWTLTLENILPDSRYRVTRRSNGEELASGVAATDLVELPGLPAYSSSMLVDITVRLASPPGPYYRIFDTAANSNPRGASAYILQQLDE